MIILPLMIHHAYKTNYVIRLDYTNIIILIILMNSLLKNAVLYLNTFIQSFLKNIFNC